MVQNNYPLERHNSFGIRVRSALYTAPEGLEELERIVSAHDLRNLPFLILGEGSNLLFTRDYEGLVIHPQMKGTELLYEEKKEVFIRVGAAENWDRWVEDSLEAGWYGLENLSLIPGSVGSAPVQNIGAYGVELKDRFAWLDAWDLFDNKAVRISLEECNFGYRNSIFKSLHPRRYLITHVVFRLLKNPSLQLEYGPVREMFEKAGGDTPSDLREVIISIRRQKLPDPAEVGNAGSFFKNPVVERSLFQELQAGYSYMPFFHAGSDKIKIPAAWLIEKAGWKGKRIGNVGTWPGQPLVIVNYGGAGGQEILDFSEKIRTDVEQKFGITLEPEVNIVH